MSGESKEYWAVHNAIIGMSANAAARLNLHSALHKLSDGQTKEVKGHYIYDAEADEEPKNRK